MENSMVKQETNAVADVQLNDMVFVPERFAAMNQLAEVMASGNCTVPRHLAGNKGDCFAIVMQSMMWRMNPFAVAQKTHLVNGTLGYEAQLVNAVVTDHIKGAFHYDWFGPWENVVGKFKWCEGKNGTRFQAPGWKPEDETGCGVTVSATLKGETEPRELSLLLCQATVRNSTLWASDPKQQLAYLAVKRWARLYKPGAILGVYSVDELEQEEPVNVTPEEEKPKKGTTATGKLKSKLMKEKEPVVDAEEVVEEKTEKLSAKIQAEIDRVGAPVSVADVEKYLKAKNLIPTAISIDDIDHYPAKTLESVTNRMPDLVNAASEWSVSSDTLV